jgi:hypothetical protein
MIGSESLRVGLWRETLWVVVVVGSRLVCLVWWWPWMVVADLQSGVWRVCYTVR